MHHFKTPEEDDRISHGAVSVDDHQDVPFSQLMDEFVLGLMAEPAAEGDFLLAVEDVNVGVDIMIVNGDGVVMGGMPQHLDQQQQQQQMEVFEALYQEFHVQQYVDGINIDNGGIACIDDSETEEPLGILTDVPAQPLRVVTPDNREIPVNDVPVPVQPLRILTPDNREIPVFDVPEPVPLRVLTPDNREIPVADVLVQPLEIRSPGNGVFVATDDVSLLLEPLEINRLDYAGVLATDVPLVVQPLRSLEPAGYEGNKKMDNGEEAGPSGT